MLVPYSGTNRRLLPHHGQRRDSDQQPQPGGDGYRVQHSSGGVFVGLTAHLTILHLIASILAAWRMVAETGQAVVTPGLILG